MSRFWGDRASSPPPNGPWRTPPGHQLSDFSPLPITTPSRLALAVTDEQFVELALSSSRSPTGSDTVNLKSGIFGLFWVWKRQTQQTLVFLTAFPSRQEMTRYLAEIY
ncbi:hypothetical protein ACL6C3_22685 [Capilliphycus salinus ALCB114379]|uniref:hypothetical protein n=1 Tax=Capilliphycus salinus TaxID=2768948 RepID=UPI0039A48CC9